MGNELISFYKNKVKKTWKIAFLSAFLGCLLIHLYKFTNTLPNHDSLYNVYFDQNMTGSGRWFLQYACGISSYFDLPWFNGFLSAVYLGITAALVTELFGMENPVVITLSALVLAACPSTTETFFFEYTADGYLLGMLLAVFAACVQCKEKRLPGGNVASGICLCLSLAIYQAYISFAIVLSLCWLVLRLLEYKISVRDAWKWVGKQILVYAVAMAAYYGIWKLILLVTGQNATGYQGINEVGISLSTVIGGFAESIRNILFYYFEWNILEHPITIYAVLNIIFVLCFVAVVIYAIIKSGIYKQKAKLLSLLLCLMVCIPVISIWCFVSSDTAYRPMMLHSVSVFYILALILFDRWVHTKASTLFGLFMAVVVFNFSVMANISYFYMDKCYEKSYYMGSQMMELIEEIQCEEDITAIAFIGSRAVDVAITPEFPGNRIHLLSSLLEEDLLFDDTHSYMFLRNTFDLTIPRAGEERVKLLEASDTVQQMPEWPAEGSMQVIDDILVIKLKGNT